MPQLNELLPHNFRTEDASTFLSVYERARDARPMQYPSFRDLFQGLGSHTTVLGQITRFLDSLLPERSGGLPDQSGERLKLLFVDKPGRGLLPSELADLLYNRLRPLSTYFQDLLETAYTEASGRKRNETVLRIGAPHTLTLRLLPYVCSNLEPVFADRNFRVEITSGDTDRDLLPRLDLELLDCVVGYGLERYLKTNDKDIKAGYRDPDRNRFNFAHLGSSFRMGLIVHPLDRLHIYGDSVATPGEPVDATSINLRACGKLIAVPSWRQCEGVQDLIDDARRLEKLIEPQTDDEALALVRSRCGFAAVPEVFRDRRVTDWYPLDPEYRFKRVLGVYYRNENDGLSPLACRFAEFLRLYLVKYGESQRHDHQAKKQHSPPAFDKDNPDLFPPSDIIEKMRSVADWSLFSRQSYPLHYEEPRLK